MTSYMTFSETLVINFFEIIVLSIKHKGPYWIILTFKIHLTPFKFEDSIRTTLKAYIFQYNWATVSLNKLIRSKVLW